MNDNYTACCWFPTSNGILILPSQFWQISFESYWLHCSKCRILVLLQYMYLWITQIALLCAVLLRPNGADRVLHLAPRERGSGHAPPPGGRARPLWHTDRVLPADRTHGPRTRRSSATAQEGTSALSCCFTDTRYNMRVQYHNHACIIYYCSLGFTIPSQ